MLPVPVTRLAIGGIWLALRCSAGFAQSSDWRDQRIDGSSEAGFESSVAALQNSLPLRRREDFDIALAVIWMSESLGSTGLGLDLNHDGVVDRADSHLLVDETKALLADIQRGDLLPAIDKRATNSGGEYTATNYLQRLDGLKYEEVLDLAGRPAKVTLAALRRADARRQQQHAGGRDHHIQDSAFQGLIHGGVTQPPVGPVAR